MKCKNLVNNKAVIGLALASFTIGVISPGVGGVCGAAIVFPKAPEEGRAIVQEQVGQILQAHPRTLGEVRIENLTIGEPHRWYSVGLTDLASGRLLSAATSRTWRYILMHGTDAVGVATVIDADAKTGNAQGFGGLYETGLGKETIEALQVAEKLPQVGKQDYEPRFLEAMSVSFFAVWLHGKTNDIIIPLPPTYGRMTAYQPYSEAQIIGFLKPDVEKAKKMDNASHESQSARSSSSNAPR